MPANQWCVFGVTALAILLGGCPSRDDWPDSEYDDNLVADYFVHAPDTIEQASVVRKYRRRGAGFVPYFVGPMVFAYGWNDDFIIAKQHPDDPNENHKIDTSITHWYIVEVKTEEIHGPLTEDEFRQSRIKLGIPAKMSFTKTLEVPGPKRITGDPNSAGR